MVAATAAAATAATAATSAVAGLAREREKEIDVGPKGKVMTYLSTCFGTQTKSMQILSQLRTLLLWHPCIKNIATLAQIPHFMADVL